MNVELTEEEVEFLRWVFEVASEHIGCDPEAFRTYQGISAKLSQDSKRTAE